MKKIGKNEYEFTILRPGGNDQMLIKGIIPNDQKRKINDEMIRRFPNVEQVSFYEFDQKNKLARLELAGGEFCGNATRSLAYLLLNGKKGQIRIRVSGTTKKLIAGIKKEGTAFAQMPINNPKSIRKLNSNIFRVDLEGITQLIYLQNQQIDLKKLKKLASEILQKENLIYSVPAAGVMFIKEKGDFIDMEPVVWVRDIETLLYETACASGTAAVGLWKASQENNPYTEVKIQQPTGKIIKAQVTKKNNSFEVFIDGEIEILQKGIETL